MWKPQMKMLLLGVVHALYVHVVTGQGASDGTIGVERQIGQVHDRLLPYSMPKAYAMALLAESSGIIRKPAFGGGKRKPTPQLVSRCDMTDGTVALVGMRIFDVGCYVSGFICRTAISG